MNIKKRKTCQIQPLRLEIGQHHLYRSWKHVNTNQIRLKELYVPVVSFPFN